MPTFKTSVPNAKGLILDLYNFKNKSRPYPKTSNLYPKQQFPEPSGNFHFTDTFMKYHTQGSDQKNNPIYKNNDKRGQNSEQTLFTLKNT